MLLEVLSDVRRDILIAFGALFAVYIFNVLKRRIKWNIPPGPMGLPIVGYLPFMTNYPYLKFMELGKKYGDIFSVRLGSELVVILNSTKSIREAFGKNELLGRPPNSSFTLFGNESPFFVGGVHIWQEQRKFVVQSMKDLGLGKSKIESHILDEIRHFLAELEKTNGEPIDPKPPLTPSMSNNICALTFGTRYEYSDPERQALDKFLEEVSIVIGQTSFHIFFPWIKHLPFVIRMLKYDKALKSFKVMEEYFRKKIEFHKQTLDPKNIRDFIDSYLIEMKTRKEKDPDTTFSDKSLEGNVSDLFGAGSETVRSSILWCIYIMAAYPEVQKKVRKEILEILGPDRSPEFQDQKNMPYTHAVLLEVMRWQTVVPLNLLRYTLADVNVGGYDIPKNTLVLANLWAPHHDPDNWQEPDIFKPGRFLGPDSKIVKSNNFLPFSVGKRACPGETMANMEIFLYFVSMLQKFEITVPEGVKLTFETEPGITLKPKPYKVRFMPTS